MACAHEHNFPGWRCTRGPHNDGPCALIPAHSIVNSFFGRISRLLGKPVFWAFVIGALAGALGLNIVSGNRFDPGMAYSNFLQNWVQVVALAVSCVATVSMVTRDDTLHEKIDALHKK